MKIQALSLITCLSATAAFAPSHQSIQRTTTSLNELNDSNMENEHGRRAFISQATTAFTAIATTSTLLNPSKASADMDVDDFLKSGQVSMPMGVSGQAGKSKPDTGIVFRDGTDVSRDSKTGGVLAEILLNARSSDPTAVLATFDSPWSLAKGFVYDIECRDSSTGDGSFLSVSNKANGKSVEELPTSFFLNKLFGNTGRYSFYGPPTDIKTKKSYMDGPNRVIELSFSLISQSTGAEIPRSAIVVATIPEGTDEAVMLATSSTAARWRKGTEKDARKVSESFRVVPSPKTGLKVRARVNQSEVIDF